MSYDGAIDALKYARDIGFRFSCLPDGHGGYTAICGERPRIGGVLDLCMITDVHAALAMRFGTDGGRAHDRPLWKRRGEVAEVIRELIELPPPGTPGAPGAPTRELRTPSELWLPPSLL